MESKIEVQVSGIRPKSRRLGRRVLKWVGVGLVLLIGVGVVFQTIATALDKNAYPPRGQLYDVNGHKMHLNCVGEGSPTVILESGGFSFSLEWYWVQRQLAQTNRVCSYDRSGTGWSEWSDAPRTPANIVADLHTLLQVANVPAPYVLVGHSFGAVLNRIYTHYYPDEVLGVVLVDTAIFPPDSLDTQAKIDEWRFGNDVLQTVLWAMVRTGAARFVVGSEVESLGYPPDIAAELTALKVSNQSFDTYYAESFPVRLELVQEAKKGENLGDLPLLALWATVLPRQLTPEEQDQLARIQQATSEYSSNGVSRMVEGSTHGSIIGSEVYAERVSDAVYDVIGSVESGEPLTK